MKKSLKPLEYLLTMVNLHSYSADCLQHQYLLSLYTLRKQIGRNTHVYRELTIPLANKDFETLSRSVCEGKGRGGHGTQSKGKGSGSTLLDTTEGNHRSVADTALSGAAKHTKLRRRWRVRAWTGTNLLAGSLWSMTEPTEDGAKQTREQNKADKKLKAHLVKQRL